MLRALPYGTGPSQAEPEVSALWASVPSVDWWEQDPEFIEYLDDMERQDNDRENRPQ